MFFLIQEIVGLHVYSRLGAQAREQVSDSRERESTFPLSSTVLCNISLLSSWAATYFHSAVFVHTHYLFQNDPKVWAISSACLFEKTPILLAYLEKLANSEMVSLQIYLTLRKVFPFCFQLQNLESALLVLISPIAANQNK